jgi:hypothetical protein
VSVLDHFRQPGWPRRALFGLGLLLALTVIIRLGHLDWRRLLHAELAARLRLDGPKMVMTARGGKGGNQKIPDIGAALEKVIPARVDRVEVREGEFLYRDVTAPHHPEFWLHDIELAAENLTTRKRLAGGRPATVSARATLGAV